MIRHLKEDKQAAVKERDKPLLSQMLAYIEEPWEFISILKYVTTRVIM
jgi:hypothetical protein